MKKDPIEAIGIDERGSLWVKPATATFPYIYREAMEVHWDAEHLRLYSPKPRERSYHEWFKQIICAAHYQGVDLRVGEATSWSGIDTELKQAIVVNCGS